MEKCPPLIKALTFLLVFCFFLGVSMDKHVRTIPLLVVHEKQVFRLFLSAFFEGNIVNLVVAIYMLNTWACRVENILGSKSFAFLFLQLVVLINLVVCAVTYSIYWYTKDSRYLLYSTSGMYPSLVALLVVNPPSQPVALLCLPISIPPRYVALVLVLLSSLLSLHVPLDLLGALVIGALYSMIYKLTDGETILPTSYSTFANNKFPGKGNNLIPSRLASVDKTPREAAYCAAEERRVHPTENISLL